MANNEVVFDRSALSVIDMQFLEMKREMGRISEIGTYLINKAKYVVQAVEALAAATGGQITVPADITNLINDIYTTSNSIIDNMGTQVSSFAALNETVMQELSTLTELLNQIFDGDSYNIQVRDDSNSESEGTTFNELLKEYMNGQNEQVNTGTADIDSSLAPWTEEQKKVAAESGTILLDMDELLERVLNKDEETEEETNEEENSDTSTANIVESETENDDWIDKYRNSGLTDEQIKKLNGRDINDLTPAELYSTFSMEELDYMNANCSAEVWKRENIRLPEDIVYTYGAENPAINTGNDYAPSSFTFEKPDINESDVDWEQYTGDKYDRYRTDVHEDETDS